MKKCLLFVTLLAILFTSLPVYGVEYESGLVQAKKENKPLYLYLNSPSCYYCVAMEKTTLADKEIVALLKKDFVFVMADIDKRDDLLKTYPIRGTPSSVFLDPSGSKIRSLPTIPGYIGKSDLKMVLEYIRDGHYKNTEFAKYRKKHSKTDPK
jgi:thioredoxin-related protein